MRRSSSSCKGATMKVLVLGATGMVGLGVLRECLAAPDVKKVATLGRRSAGRVHPKLDSHVTSALDNLPDTLLSQFDGFDACFFCLGVSSSGMDEATYTRLTHDLTLGVASPLAARNPGMTFVYVSGAGTGSASRTMWARVKGETEGRSDRTAVSCNLLPASRRDPAGAWGAVRRRLLSHLLSLRRANAACCPPARAASPSDH